MAKNTNKKSIKNTIALKRNIYAIIVSLIFIVAVVLLNILATALADRYPLDIDLTSDKKHSMTDDNIDYIKQIDKEVNIYVCLTEEEYSCTSESSYNMLYYAAQQQFVDYNSKNAGYFVQTAELLRKYEMYNDNINVIFLDMVQPSATEITEEFEAFEWQIGDILVESSIVRDAEGKKVSSRKAAIPFGNIYELEAGEQTEQMYMYYLYGMVPNYALNGIEMGYMISENNIEYAVSSAMYKVTSDTTPTFLVPKSYCNTSFITTALEKTLVENNFAIVYEEGLLTTLLSGTNAEKYDGVILGDCKSDISSDDRAVLEAFLHNDGKKEKSLAYFAGTTTHSLKNLCGLLGDWGIGFESGILYETGASNVIAEVPTDMYLKSLETEYTKTSDRLGKYYVGCNMVPMSQIYTTNNTGTYSRETHVLMRTGGYGLTAIMPIDADSTKWTAPEDAKKDTFPTVMLSEDTKTNENKEFVTSSVVAFSSADFASSKYATNQAVANVNFALDVFNAITGNTDTPFTFVAKTISNESYLVNVTTAKTNIIKWIFMAIVPISLVVFGIVIWFWRKIK